MPHSTQPPLTQDRRRHPRVAKNIPVKISSQAGDILTETINVSISGAYCRLSQKLEPMTVLRVQLLLPAPEKTAAKKVSCSGVVVRAEPAGDGANFDTAIFFSSIAPKDIRIIDDFIDSHLEKKNHGQYN